MQINTLFNNNLIMWSNYLLMIMYCLIILLNIIYNNISYCLPIKNFVRGILCARLANLFIKVILLLKSAQPQRRQIPLGAPELRHPLGRLSTQLAKRQCCAWTVVRELVPTLVERELNALHFCLMNVVVISRCLTSFQGGRARFTLK